MQRLPAAQGGAAKSKAMTPVMDFAAGRVRATPCAPRPTAMQGVKPPLEQAAGESADPSRL